MPSKTTVFDDATDSNLPAVADSDESWEDQPEAMGMADFSGDLRPDPKTFTVSALRIIQGMSDAVKQKKGNPGQWLLPNYPARDTVTIIPFDSQPIRRYMPDPKKPPVCVSKNGIFGIGVPGGRCEDCPLSQWGDRDETGKGKPPVCKDGVVVRGYVPEFRRMVDLPLMTSSARIGREMAQRSLSDGWCSFAVQLSIETKSNPKGTWYIPSVQYQDEVTQEDMDAAWDWYQVHLAMKNARRQELGLPPVELPALPASS